MRSSESNRAMQPTKKLAADRERWVVVEIMKLAESDH